MHCWSCWLSHGVSYIIIPLVSTLYLVTGFRFAALPRFSMEMIMGADKEIKGVYGSSFSLLYFCASRSSFNGEIRRLRNLLPKRRVIWSMKRHKWPLFASYLLQLECLIVNAMRTKSFDHC